MKRNLAIFALTLAASTLALANGGGIGNTYNNPTAEGGTAVAGALAGAVSISEGGEATAIGIGGRGGAGGVGVGGLGQGGSVGAITIGQESNTPPVVPGVLPSVPTTCRLYMFGGGATRDGAASGSIPLGNDITCLSIAKLNLMERVGGFTQAEKQSVACEVEGMSKLDTCQKLGAK